jgi:hypothetical protein
VAFDPQVTTFTQQVRVWVGVREWVDGLISRDLTLKVQDLQAGVGVCVWWVGGSRWVCV